MATAVNAARSHLPPPDPCSLDWGSADRCQGHPQFALLSTDPNEQEQNAKWIKKGNKFPKDGGKVFRAANGEGSKWPEHRVSAIADAHRIDMSGIGAHGLIIARIRIEQDKGLPDKRYGITKRPASGGPEFERDFYLAIFNHTPNGDVQMGGKAVASWQVLGITKQGKQLVAIGTSGKFRDCVEPHPPVPLTASFRTCVFHNLLAKAAANASLKATGVKSITVFEGLHQLVAKGPTARDEIARALAGLLPESEIRQILDEISGELAPAWMSCGLGCCTAEF